MKTKEELVEQYVNIAKKITDLKKEQDLVLADLALTDKHKVGEIVKWTETNRTKNVGTLWQPKRMLLPDKEYVAVLCNIKVNFWNIKALDIRYDYTFHPITKDGSISKNTCYVPRDCEWTGEIHKDYLKEK